jgi:hypothetical protein
MQEFTIAQIEKAVNAWREAEVRAKSQARIDD